MLQVRKLHIAMKKDLRELVRDFTFALNPGDKAAIIGEEGNGKSTLLKLIYDENLAEGYVEWSGAIQKDGMILGYLSQELPEEDRDKTAYEFCCGEEAFLDSSPKEVADAAAKLRFPADLFYSDRKMGTFSGGEKVKLRMALLTLRRPDCYLLDEPSNDLDIETLEWLESFIQECPQPVLYISHDEMLLENTANVIIHLEQLRRKTLPRYTVPGWATGGMWRSGFRNSPTRSRWPRRSGRRSASARRSCGRSSRRCSTSWTTSPTRTGTTWGRC